MTDAILSLAGALPLLGPIILLTAWPALRGDPDNRRAFLRLWLVVLLAQFGAGWFAGHLDPAATRRGLAILYSGSTWLVGPVLACFARKPQRLGLEMPVGALMSLLGVVLALFVALFTGVINPCG